MDAIRDAGMVLSQLEIPMDTVRHLGEVCARLNVPLMLDPSPARPLTADLLQKVAWLTPNETEIACCVRKAENANQPDAPEIIDALLKQCEGVVLKIGSRGAFIATRDGARHRVNSFRVTAIDTTAAGDSFNGAFAVGLMQGKSPVEAAQFAAAAAAVSVTRAGAQPSMPTLDEANLMLSRGSVAG